ncbi:MAG: DUF99 family protein [Methanomassiliicoccales archaeon]|nr:DUF99 family protein [Methanomassiliicoccales archaeon]
MLGIDDSPFLFSDSEVTVIGVVMRVPDYVEGVMHSRLTIDGEDGNDVLAKMINSSRYKEQLRLIMLDGIAMGGFNVIDIDALSQSTGLPVASVTRDPPDLAKMEAALKGHFVDWERRLRIVTRSKLFEVQTAHKPLHVATAGIGNDEAAELIGSSIVRGALPEPIRIAHLIASAIERGESKGDA